MEGITKIRVVGSAEQIVRFGEIIEDLTAEKRIEVVNSSGVFPDKKEYFEINILEKKDNSQKRNTLEEIAEEDENNVPFHVLLLCELSSHNLLKTEKNELLKAMRFEEWSNNFNQLCGIALYKEWDMNDFFYFIDNIFPQKIGEKRYEESKAKSN